MPITARIFVAPADDETVDDDQDADVVSLTEYRRTSNLRVLGFDARKGA